MLDSRKVRNVPRQSELYYWADFVELLCLTDVDGVFSADMLGQIVGFADDLGAMDAVDGDDADIEAIILGADESAEGLDETEVSSGEPADLGLEEFEYGDFGRDAEVADNRSRWCKNIFTFLAARSRALEARYPFEVDSVRMRIMRKSDSVGYRPYLFLLACSLLPHMTKRSAQKLTMAFEAFSAEVLKCLLPASAKVEVYGTSRKGKSSGSAPYERLQELAAALNGEVRVSRRDFHPGDTGDNGLDLVGWVPMQDPAEGVLVLFGQCACGRKWDGKQYEAAYVRWRNFVELKSPSVDTTFIPHYYRKPGDSWYSASDVQGLLVDRLRALRLLGDDAVRHLPADLVDEFVAFKRPID